MAHDTWSEDNSALYRQLAGVSVPRRAEELQTAQPTRNLRLGMVAVIQSFKAPVNVRYWRPSPT